jgi:hypothetical protein
VQKEGGIHHAESDSIIRCDDAGDVGDDVRRPRFHDVTDDADGASGERIRVESSNASNDARVCPVCRLDARARDASADAWCVACYLTREWGARVVEREPGEDDDEDGEGRA